MSKYWNRKNSMYYTSGKSNFEYTKENRRRSTPAEDLLWYALRNKRPDGYTFRRQQYMESLGLKVLRFSNEEVLNHLNFVLESIRENLTIPQ